MYNIPLPPVNKLILLMKISEEEETNRFDSTFDRNLKM